MEIEANKILARNLFETEKDFLIQLYQKKAEILLTNPTESQIETLAYILYFIAKKEIPIFKEYRKNIENKHFIKKVKNFNKPFNEIKDIPHEILMEHILSFLPYWHFLVLPILFEKNPENKVIKLNIEEKETLKTLENEIKKVE